MNPENYNLRSQKTITIQPSSPARRSGLHQLQQQQPEPEAVQMDIFDMALHSTVTMEAFSGTGTDPKKWMSWYERYASLSNLKDERVAQALPFHLKGVARTWYDSLSEATQQSMAQLKAAFLDRFKLSTNLDISVLSLHQKQDETVEVYFARCLDIIQGRGLPENLTVSLLLKGLEPELLKLVMPQNPQTIEAVRQAMVLAEQTISATKSRQLNMCQSPAAGS